MKNIFIIIILIIIIGVGGWFLLESRQTESAEENSTTDTELTTDEDVVVQKNNEEEEMKMTYQFKGDLADVTASKTVTGVNTGDNATGVAQANFTDSAYSLLATFENLPDPQGSDFYEGWVVRKGLNLSVISTGKAEKKDGVYQNIYTADQDLTDHNFYVLTIEPDDGDPAPAEHILEGTMTAVQ